MKLINTTCGVGFIYLALWLLRYAVKKQATNYKSVLDLSVFVANFGFLLAVISAQTALDISGAACVWGILTVQLYIATGFLAVPFKSVGQNWKNLLTYDVLSTLFCGMVFMTCFIVISTGDIHSETFIGFPSILCIQATFWTIFITIHVTCQLKHISSIHHTSTFRSLKC